MAGGLLHRASTMCGQGAARFYMANGFAAQLFLSWVGHVLALERFRIAMISRIVYRVSSGSTAKNDTIPATTWYAGDAALR
jgi:hypothetical protein